MCALSRRAEKRKKISAVMNVDLSVAPQKHSDDVIGPGPLISSTVYTHCEEVKIFLFLNCV